jgi:predicted lysophospholipase L1 biosynthesis ABC-type transport system permease subunit
MTELSRLEQVRTAALDRIDRAERQYKRGIVFVAACEALFGLLYLVLMDWHDRLHWLILVAACLTYSVVLGGIINLGLYVNNGTRAILRAVLDERPAERET